MWQDWDSWRHESEGCDVATSDLDEITNEKLGQWLHFLLLKHTINNGMNIEEEHCTASVLMLNNTFEKCARV